MTEAPPSRLLLAVAALLGALVVGLAVFWRPELPPAPLPGSALPRGGDFTLQSADGPVSLADYRGKLVLLYFGYTYCPDVCPTALSAIAGGLQQLDAKELAQVATIFVSVDPQRDTPARLKEYAAFFHPSIVGVTGPNAQIADVTRAYGAFYAAQAADTAGGYVVDHTSDTYVIGRDGQLLGRIAHGTAGAEVAARLRQYLVQP